MVKSRINDKANSSGGSSRIEPWYIVANQLKTLIADGIATMKVRNEKTSTAMSLMPLVYMWCAHTSEPVTAIAKEEATSPL